MGKWTDELRAKEERDDSVRFAKRNEESRTNELIDNKGEAFWKDTIEWLVAEIKDLKQQFPDRDDRNVTFTKCSDQIKVEGNTFPQVSFVAPLAPSGRSLLIIVLEQRNRHEGEKQIKTEVAIRLDTGDHIHFDYDDESYIDPAKFGGYLLRKVLRLK